MLFSFMVGKECSWVKKKRTCIRKTWTTSTQRAVHYNVEPSLQVLMPVWYSGALCPPAHGRGYSHIYLSGLPGGLNQMKRAGKNVSRYYNLYYTNSYHYLTYMEFVLYTRHYSKCFIWIYSFNTPPPQRQVVGSFNDPSLLLRKLKQKYWAICPRFYTWSVVETEFVIQDSTVIFPSRSKT